MNEYQKALDNAAAFGIMRADWKPLNELVKRATPRPPYIAKVQDISYATVMECPACAGKLAGFGSVKFCYHCGQALKWPKESEAK
jgi:hypothetical protein